MPALDAVLQLFSWASAEHAEEDLAAVYEVGPMAAPGPDALDRLSLSSALPTAQARQHLVSET